VCALAVTIAAANDNAEEEVIGRGAWGETTHGIVVRVTTDKREYTIGDKVIFLVEAKNMTNNPIVLGLEPLIEVSNGTLSRQPAEVHTHFTQQSNGTLGFFCTTYSPFPSGTKKEAKAVALKPGEVYSEVIVRTPWGPSYGCLPSEAQSGNMKLSITLHQFVRDGLKKTGIKSNEVELVIKSKTDSNKKIQRTK